MPLEELHGFLMLLCRRARLERAEVTALAGLGIFLARIEPVFAGGELSDHDDRVCAATARATAPLSSLGPVPTVRGNHEKSRTLCRFRLYPRLNKFCSQRSNHLEYHLR